MTHQQKLILGRLQANLEDARTPAMREFCKKQIAEFEASTARRNRKPATPPKAFARFLSSFD